MSKQLEVVMYIVVNKELDMSAGKIGAQVGHGVEKVVHSIVESKYNWEPNTIDNGYDAMNYDAWKHQGSKKVVVKASEKKMRELISFGAYPVFDSGLTEVEPDSLTVVAFPPRTRAEMKIFTGRLRLL